MSMHIVLRNKLKIRESKINTNIFVSIFTICENYRTRRKSQFVRNIQTEPRLEGRGQTDLHAREINVEGTEPRKHSQNTREDRIV